MERSETIHYLSVNKKYSNILVTRASYKLGESRSASKGYIDQANSERPSGRRTRIKKV